MTDGPAFTTPQRRLVSGLAATVCVVALASAAPAQDGGGAPIAIDDNGTVRINDDALVVGRDGTVTIGGGRLRYTPGGRTVLEMRGTPDGAPALRVHADGSVDVNGTRILPDGRVLIRSDILGTYFQRKPDLDDLSVNFCTATGVAKCQDYMIENPSCGDAQTHVVDTGRCRWVGRDGRVVSGSCVYAECRTNVLEAIVAASAYGSVTVRYKRSENRNIFCTPTAPATCNVQGQPVCPEGTAARETREQILPNQIEAPDSDLLMTRNFVCYPN